MENITVRLAPDFVAGRYGQSRMRTQSSASSLLTMPLLTFNRKDTGGQSIGGKNAMTASSAEFPSKRFQCGGIVTGAAGTERPSEPISRNRGYIA